MKATSVPTSSTQLIIDVQDTSLVKDIKRLLSRIQGVGEIYVNKNYYESKEFYQDIDAAERDIANGNCTRIDSKEALDLLFV